MWFLISFFEDQNLLFDKGGGTFPKTEFLIHKKCQKALYLIDSMQPIMCQ